MDAAHTIRGAVARVDEIRQRAANDPTRHAALLKIKSLQARRFAGTYSDLLGSEEYGDAARFFLEDLYSDKDYTQRDAQFSRIAGALQRLFPQQVIATAVALAELHLLTEDLDWQMANQWCAQTPGVAGVDAAHYIACWRSVGQHESRIPQLKVVLTVGRDLDRLTQTPGLRLMLRMMRRPAKAAGLGSLQDFLECGFDTFAKMSGKGHSADDFLNRIQTRESAWIHRLSYGDIKECEVELMRSLP